MSTKPASLHGDKGPLLCQPVIPARSVSSQGRPMANGHDPIANQQKPGVAIL
ncbi:hypothetical protein [Hymenobacter terrenus]|uniref:hypothetical protein n=1 Tax=Hymenobacter terrenus TaxID=1629124 RepID=UPI0012E099D1|nr:hypothetical protein [Hymenobacter terrenus]